MTETLRLKPFSTFAELSERDKQATAAGLTVAVNGAMKALKIHYPGAVERYGNIAAALDNLTRSSELMLAGGLDAHLLVGEGVTDVRGVASFAETSPKIRGYEGLPGWLRALTDPEQMSLYRSLGCNVTFWTLPELAKPAAVAVVAETRRRFDMVEDIRPYTLVPMDDAVAHRDTRDPAGALRGQGFVSTGIVGKSQLTANPQPHKAIYLPKPA